MFDGKAPFLKSGELAKRSERRKEAQAQLDQAKELEDVEKISKFNKRLVKVGRKHNDDCKRLLRLMGLPIIEAPSEAEAQCAEMCKDGLVYATATEDMDGLTFGSPRLIRNLSSGSGEKFKEYQLERVLSALGLNQRQFVDLGILMGCDYCDSIKGIGGKKGLELILKFGSIENILEKKYNISTFIEVDIDYGDRKIEEVPEEIKEPKEEQMDIDESQVEDNKETEEDILENSDKDEDRDEAKEDKKETKNAKTKQVKNMVPENWLFLGARKLFEEPNVLKSIDESTLKQKDMDESGIITFLCQENGFSEDRVRSTLNRVKASKGKCSQTRIDNFFKTLPPKPQTNGKQNPPKRNALNKLSTSSSKRGRKPK